MRRAVIVLLVILAICISGFISPNSYQNDKHTFTWISQVTPELASWAKNLSFTDVVVSDNSKSSYLNLEKEGITYWHLVSSYALYSSNSSVEFFRQALANLVSQSPNGHVYLDDTHYIFLKCGVSAANNLLDAVRLVQTNNCSKFIIDGFLHVCTSRLYSQANMTGIDFDAYQAPPASYNLSQLEMAEPKSVGLYVWAYGCVGLGSLSWDTMTDQYLASVYKQAKGNNLVRLIIWDGYNEAPDCCMEAACLYCHPEWWDKIRAENMEFLQ